MGIFAICAESDEEAIALSASASAWRNRVQQGKSSNFPLVEEALKEVKEASTNNALGKGSNRPFIGSQNTIYERLQPLIKLTDPEELKIITICEPFEAKTNSYKLIKEVFDQN